MIAIVGVAAWFVTRPSSGGADGKLGIRPGSAQGYNIVLFTLDTLRADRLGCYGYQPARTPVLDALAAGGVRFDHAVTAAPMTLPSHATILTGNYPPTHGVRDNGTYVLPDDQQTIAETLKGNGYDTAAFIAAFVLERRYGLAQGFDLYDDNITLKYRAEGVRQASPQRPGDAVVDSALAWMDERKRTVGDKPFFAWIHLFDPHAPYEAPEPFGSEFASEPYDGEIAFTDQQVGRFLDRLRADNLWDRTIVVVVSDHGEGMGDHGESTHSLLIYGATMRVPFIVSAPGLIKSGAVVSDRVVATVDIVPTVLDLLGLGGDGYDGVSLFRDTEDRDVYMETLAPRLNHGWSALYGVQNAAEKFIDAPTDEYYDLAADPGELKNLLVRRSDDARRMERSLKEMIDAFPLFESSAAGSVTPTAADLAKLQDLGYVGGVSDICEGPFPDPKEMVKMFEAKIGAARMLVDQGRPAEAIPVIQEVRQQAPCDARLASLLSYSQEQAERLDDAIQSRLDSIRLQPTDANHWLHLAQLYRRVEDYEKMKDALAEVDKLEPTNGELQLIRAQMAIQEGELERALTLCKNAREYDPTRHTATSLSLEADIYEKLGRLEASQRAYEKAYAADPKDTGALVGLARIALNRGDAANTLRFAEQVLAGEPRWPAARLLVARAHLTLDQADKAVAIMREVVETYPQDPAHQSNLGNVLYSVGRLSEAIDAYRAAVALDPAYMNGYFNQAMAMHALGNEAAAIQLLRNAAQTFDDDVAADMLDRAVGAIAESADLLFDLAWLLATSADEKVRDGARAVEMADRGASLTESPTASHLRIAAAAHAASGGFEYAIRSANQAKDLAEQGGDQILAADIQQELNLYQTGQSIVRNPE